MSELARLKQQHADFLLVLLLFVSFRLMMLMAYPASCLINCSDQQFYFEVVASVRQGYYPFIDFWYEFAPIFPYLSLGLYLLAQGSYQNYLAWLGVALLLFDAGTLSLLYDLARRLYNPVQAVKLSWVYASLFVPFYFWRSTFDPLTTFLMMLTLYGLLRRRYRLLNISLGLGVMVKYMPIILLPVIYRHSGFKRAMQALAAACIISLLIFGPFWLISPDFVLASLQAQFVRPAWQTVWAWLNGNLEAGGFGPMSTRFNPDLTEVSATTPPLISPWLMLLVFGGVGLVVLLKARRQPSELDSLAFAAFTVVIFFLWSPGWSPQWQLYLTPLLLLALPLGKALTYLLGLGLINFLEWPMIYGRGLTQLLPLTFIGRFLLLALLAVELYRVLNSQDSWNNHREGDQQL